MNPTYTPIEKVVLETLKESSEIGRKKEGVALNDFYSNLPDANTFTKAQVGHAIAVLSVEGLVLTDGEGRVIDITRTGVTATRTF